jgi:hypothetical protein
MEVEREKALAAISKVENSKHSYQVITCGIGRESIAKTMMNLPSSDCTVLTGFTAIIGQEDIQPEALKKGKVVEVTTSSLFGYQGELFENGSVIVANSKTNLPCLLSLTSDKFVKTTHLTIGTLINMEDYTFMYLKRPQDFCIRIVSDFLPHLHEIDFFKEVEEIDFLPVIQAIEKVT